MTTRRWVAGLVGVVMAVGVSWAGDEGVGAGSAGRSPDVRWQRELDVSVRLGLIQTPADYQAALERIRQRTDFRILLDQRGGVAAEITRLAARIPSLDRDAVKVSMDQISKAHLFRPIPQVPRSYSDVVALARRFDPRVGTDDAARLDRDIDAYLDSIRNDPVIGYALSTTQTTLADLKRNWFGPGAGFEHVLCGEVKTTAVSGYHFWYKFYVDERDRLAEYVKSVGPANDPLAFTGEFTWDPDGSGPLPRAKKKKGGFTLGNSAQALFALGHLAIETARRIEGQTPAGLTFQANINGRTYNWQLWTHQGTIRTMYPLQAKQDPEPDRLLQEYFELEAELLPRR